MFSLDFCKKKQARVSRTQIKIGEEELNQFSSRVRAEFVNSLSGFKSLNLVGTINPQGQTNLSIISSAFHLGSNPSLLGFIIRPDISPRHTLENIRDNKLCTLNHVNKMIYKKAHQTSARYERDQSEFTECGLTPEYKNGFIAPFVKESLISMSIEIQREVNIEENGTHMLIGKIIDVYLPENILLEDGYVDIEKAQTICVSALDSYHETTRIDKLSYAKPFKEPTSI